LSAIVKISAGQPARKLSLFDSTCLIAGIIIGVGIYQTVPDIARGGHVWWGVLLLWAAGGLITLCGALGYAELASAYPQQGGDYVYLSRAYGNGAGFLFGWVQLVIVRPGDIAVMAFAFAIYARAMLGGWTGLPETWDDRLYAATAVIVLTVVNMVGVTQSKWTQNLLTVAKAAGLLLIVALAFLAPPAQPVTAAVDPLPVSLALILVLFTFGGWNEMAYVAAEVRSPSRNIARALIAGTLAVTVLYLLVNSAFLYALGHAGVANSEAVAADAVARVFPDYGGQYISGLICISALGAVNGLIFSGARVSYAGGRDYRVIRSLGVWHQRYGTPVPALLLQGAIALVLIVVLGSFVDTLLYTAPAVYSFYLATSIAVIVLRRKHPDLHRPYRVTAYPAPTLLFCTVCAFLIFSAASYRPLIAGAALCIFLLGIPLYRWSLRSQATE
jgi:amino acid transporter